jgi:hypothetical protein
MGTPPAPSYATLYYGIYETNTLLTTFSNSLADFVRYIDDGLGVWISNPDPLTDAHRWAHFQAITGFGKLTWTVSPLQRAVNFLDLCISLTPDNAIQTRLYEKELNLYLYLPPHSAHPPGLLRGLIIGMVFRILRLTTHLSDARDDIKQLYFRLHNRGYQRTTLVPLFESAYSLVRRHLRSPPLNPLAAPAPDPLRNSVFFHVPYNRLDPSRRTLQLLFRECLLKPIGETPLPALRTDDGYACDLDPLIVCYHQQFNLKNILFPRRLRQHANHPVSSFFPPLDPDPPPADPHDQITPFCSPANL